jgi:hypothetical protein
MPKRTYDELLALVDVSDLNDDLEKRSEEAIRQVKVGRLGAIAAQKRFNAHGKGNFTAATGSRRRHPIDAAFFSIRDYGVPREDWEQFLTSFFYRFDRLKEGDSKEEIFGGENIGGRA